jgi:hypothetical protein
MNNLKQYLIGKRTSEKGNAKNKFLKFILLSLILFFLNNKSFSQCDESLVDRAIKNSGKDVLFIRDFKIKNTKKRMTFLSPIVSYELRLNKGIVYRFYVENEEVYEGEAILQVFDDDMLLASTYNFETKTDEKTFDFICEETGAYELIMSFIEPKEGCAVGIMSVVITDSLSFTDLIEKTELTNILYVGIDNYLDIATNNVNAAKIDVSINKGIIESENDLYKVRVEEEGLVVITAVVKDSLNNILETFEEEFIAKILKLPRISLEGNTGGLIPRDLILYSSPKLELNYFSDTYEFEIYEFTVSKYPYSGGIKALNTNVLTQGQIKLIENLSSGETFYITNILIKSSTGVVYELDKIGFIIE